MREPGEQRTMIVWSNGERYVFRDGEIDDLIGLARIAQDTAHAWELLEIYGKEVGAHD